MTLVPQGEVFGFVGASVKPEEAALEQQANLAQLELAFILALELHYFLRTL